MKNTIAFLLLALAVSGLAAPGFGQTLKLDPTANPAGAGSSQANWSVTNDGLPLLSWIQPSKDGSSSLQYSIRKGTQWSEPRTVAAHRQFFHHPAELPEVISLGSGFLAHWIEAPGAGSEAEFVYVSASHDGLKWTAPAMAHHDKSQAQHGLASAVATGDGTASLFWLQALKGEDGPVSLMRTVITAKGTELKEEVLDSDACACCPTSVAKTSRGILVAYRDHTPDNIRDISVTRLEDGRWTSPKTIFPDNWQLDACPVNAASASAKGNKVAISWYTASGDKPRVEMAVSSDAGATFTKATVISTGQAYGYTSAGIDDDGGAYVSWLERGGGEARVLVRHIASTGVPGPVVKVAEGTRQSLGYPKIVRTGGEVWVAWNSAAKVQTARLQ